MDRHQPDQASRKEPAEGSHENVNLGSDQNRNRRPEDFESKTGLHGKTDSGPEPDIFGRDIPPQDD
jgi:hypothetical protein